MRIVALLVAAVLLLGAAPETTVSVAYAASLVRAMEGPVAAALFARRHIRLEGEPGGSKALAHLIDAGLRTPDVFISADTKLLDGLVRSPHRLIDGYTTFGSARLALAYAPNSRFARQFASAGFNAKRIVALLLAPGVRIGRTDPRLDPKGARTLRALDLLGGLGGEPGSAAAIANNSPVYPEEDLAVRVESGELDAGFFYSTEIPGRNLRVVELPSPANLSGSIAYAIAVLKNASHPAAARAFVQFILNGAGRDVLQSAGVRYFRTPRRTGSP